jgi:hypothetical protein
MARIAALLFALAGGSGLVYGCSPGQSAQVHPPAVPFEEEEEEPEFEDSWGRWEPSLREAWGRRVA